VTLTMSANAGRAIRIGSFPAIAAAAALLVLAGCAEGPAYGPVPKDVAAVVIANTNLKFEPAVVTVHAGDTVEWRNQSLFNHSVTDDPAWAHGEGDAMLPAGAAPFNSGLIGHGQVFRYTFTVPGTYHYFCIPHENFAMLGTVVVEPAR